MLSTVAVAMTVPVLAAMNSMTESAFSKLIKALGKDKAMRLGSEALQAVGLRELRTPNELLAFANYLIRLGGMAESVGSALKVSAILRGAVDRPRTG